MIVRKHRMRRRPEASHSKFTRDAAIESLPADLDTCVQREPAHTPHQQCNGAASRRVGAETLGALSCLCRAFQHPLRPRHPRAVCRVSSSTRRAATAIPYDSRLALRLHPDKNERQRDSAPKESACSEGERRDNARLKRGPRDHAPNEWIGLGAEHPLPKQTRVRKVLGRSLGLFWPS